MLASPGMSAEELAASMRAHLVDRGALLGLKARLRRDIAEEFVEGPPPRGAWDKVLVSLVAEALESLGCPNSYAVFLPESRAGRKDFLADRAALAENVGVNLRDGEPVLAAVLRRAGAGRAVDRGAQTEAEAAPGASLASRLAAIRDRSAAAAAAARRGPPESAERRAAPPLPDARALAADARDGADRRRLDARRRDDLADVRGPGPTNTLKRR